MTEHAITLHPFELAAALAGTLRQVRRPVVPQPEITDDSVMFQWATFYADGHVHTWHRNGIGGENWNSDEHPGENKFAEALRRTPYKNACPLGQPGDVIWGRERWMPVRIHGKSSCKYGIKYEVDHAIEFNELARPIWTIDGVSKWRSASSMPRWASRWARPVAAVRVERANDITCDDVAACGIPPTKQILGPDWFKPIMDFSNEWNRHYAAKGFPFDANPWVWVADVGGEA